MFSGNVEATAFLLGERIDTRNYAAPDVASQNPFAYRARAGGLVVIYRFGAVVFFGVDQETQALAIKDLRPRIIDAASPTERESVTLVAGAAEDGVIESGKLALLDFSDDRLLVVADALAKSVALADDERYVTKVFEQIEPFAYKLSGTGGASLTPKALLRLLGETLVAQTRMVGRVEVQEKPDLLWERPDLQRLFARLSDEYELDDRARALTRKLDVIEGCASTLADITDAQRTHRLEVAIVMLIVIEVAVALFDLVRSLGR